MCGRTRQIGQECAGRASGCVLRRRQSKVVVRVPDASPGSYPRIVRERRARVSTLIGLGSREAMPTLFDVDDHQERTRPRQRVPRVPHASAIDAELLLMWWDDDEDETCFDAD